MDDTFNHDGAVPAPTPNDPARYARVADLVSQALRAANLATLEPDPTPSADQGDGLIGLPRRAPWLDVVADLAMAAGYLADVPADLAPRVASGTATTGEAPERRCLEAIQAAAAALDGLPGPRAHRDVMVRIALTGALRNAQAADRRP